MSNQRRLGRGLEALLGRPLGEEPGAEMQAEVTQAVPTGVAVVALSEIDRNPYQPRKDFAEEEIQSLAGSLATHGLLQSLVVRPFHGRYQLVAGERRMRAAEKLGWTEIPVRVVDVEDRQMAEVAIVENLQRKDLNPLEKAAGFAAYLERYGCPQEELALRLGIDRSTIANLIRLLELPAPVQEALRRGAVTAGHARALLPLGEEAEQIQFCRKIQDDGLSVRAVEQLVRETIQQADGEPLAATGTGPTASGPRTRSEQIVSLEQTLRVAMGTKVDLKVGAKQSGKIVIHFRNNDEFERLQRQLCQMEASEHRAAG